MTKKLNLAEVGSLRSPDPGRTPVNRSCGPIAVRSQLVRWRTANAKPPQAALAGSFAIPFSNLQIDKSSNCQQLRLAHNVRLTRAERPSIGPVGQLQRGASWCAGRLQMQNCRKLRLPEALRFHFQIFKSANLQIANSWGWLTAFA